MEAAAPPLDDLRADVDRIDQAILELLIERTEVVREIGAVKADRAERAARGAAGARGGDPAPAWRRSPTAASRGRAGAHVARAARRHHPPADADVGRGVHRRVSGLRHLGSGARPFRLGRRRCVRVDSASQALRSVSDGSATVAVLPLPNDDDPWWLALISDHHDRLRVFARLPFVADERAAKARMRTRSRSAGSSRSRAATTWRCWRSRRRPACRAAACAS